MDCINEGETVRREKCVSITKNSRAQSLLCLSGSMRIAQAKSFFFPVKKLSLYGFIDKVL